MPVGLIPSLPLTATLYMVANSVDRLHTVDVTTGVATALANALGIPEVHGMTSHAGALYALGRSGTNESVVHSRRDDGRSHSGF